MSHLNLFLEILPLTNAKSPDFSFQKAMNSKTIDKTFTNVIIKVRKCKEAGVKSLQLNEVAACSCEKKLQQDANTTCRFVHFDLFYQILLQLINSKLHLNSNLM